MNLGQAQPALKQLNLKSLAMQAGPNSMAVRRSPGSPRNASFFGVGRRRNRFLNHERYKFPSIREGRFESNSAGRDHLVQGRRPLEQLPHFISAGFGEIRLVHPGTVAGDCSFSQVLLDGLSDSLSRFLRSETLEQLHPQRTDPEGARTQFFSDIGSFLKLNGNEFVAVRPGPNKRIEAIEPRIPGPSFRNSYCVFN